MIAQQRVNKDCYAKIETPAQKVFDIFCIMRQMIFIWGCRHLMPSLYASIRWTGRLVANLFNWMSEFTFFRWLTALLSPLSLQFKLQSLPISCDVKQMVHNDQHGSLLCRCWDSDIFVRTSVFSAVGVSFRSLEGLQWQQYVLVIYGISLCRLQT